MDIFNDLIVIFWLVFMLYWLTSAFNSKKNLRTFSWSKNVGVRILLFIIVVLVLNLPGSHKFIGDNEFVFSPIIRAIGVIICALGIAFAIWARLHLGRNWGMPMSLKESPELVTTGPYTYVRHPIYTGFLTAMIGSAFVMGIFWLITFVVCGCYFIYAAKVEEGIMMKEFPNQYPDYKKKTKMLIPYIF